MNSISLQSARGSLSLTKLSCISCTDWLASSKFSSISSKGDEGEYLHRSIVPTNHFQKSLPRLPVPKLEDSCRRYLNALEPILSPSDFKRNKEIVEKFGQNEGQALHKELVAKNKRNKHTSYVSGPWFDMYLKDRRSVVLNMNPFMEFSDDVNQPYMDQLIRATNFVVSSVRFLKTHRENVLEPDVYHLNPDKTDNEKFRKFVRMLPASLSWYGAFWYKAFPLDMSQYSNLFNSTRIPRLEKDELFTDPKAKHLLVIRNGHHYVFDVLDSNGNIQTPEVIMANLKFILGDTQSKPDHPVGYLTSENRDNWANVREKLLATGNGETLRLVDSALFALILEDSDELDLNALSHLFLYGDGGNRWFDKSFSLIMTKTGRTAVNFEHSWGDGVAVLRYFNEVFKDTTTNPRIHPDTKPAITDSSNGVKKLAWQLTDDVKSAIDKAKSRYDSDTSKLDISYMQYTKFGKNYLKTKRISPDSFMQLAFQMAFFKQYNTTPATYESCSTAAFKHGRTETIRSATSATKKTCQLFSSPDSSLAEMRAAMEQCSTVHGQLTKEAAMGQGFDRHLLGLKQIAMEKGELPALYKDPAYSIINHNILSTSTLTSPALLFGGFAPVVPDGYGIGYAAQDDYLGCNVSCYPPSRDVSAFLELIRESFDDMHDVLEGKKKSVLKMKAAI